MAGTAPCLTWHTLVRLHRGKRKVLATRYGHDAGEVMAIALKEAFEYHGPGTYEIVTLAQPNRPRVGSLV